MRVCSPILNCFDFVALWLLRLEPTPKKMPYTRPSSLPPKASPVSVLPQVSPCPAPQSARTDTGTSIALPNGPLDASPDPKAAAGRGRKPKPVPQLVAEQLEAFNKADESSLYFGQYAQATLKNIRRYNVGLSACLKTRLIIKLSLVNACQQDQQW